MNFPYEESPSTQTPPRCFTSATDLFRLIDDSTTSADGSAGVLNLIHPLSHDDDFSAVQAAKATIEACQIGALFEETKFLMLESLQELIKVP